MELGIPATCLRFLASEMGTVTYLPGLWGGFAEMPYTEGFRSEASSGLYVFPNGSSDVSSYVNVRICI